ncbi:hypothetical protein [Falsiroseomonas selenitidurans]|uniref:Uncharacterized protein n=1 Tax=Falsiroseomonas selenitidurans TaxID=2716335 RepID=A0ABX1E944_9PROT|nr:hypothetical protein [Falsiroseomonas selenitidurans]NKC33468.1 hypothetical protein [Falsiroseomonas selenitidurans]
MSPTGQDAIHLQIGGYDWWWVPGSRHVSGGTDDPADDITLPGEVDPIQLAVRLYLLGWSDGRMGGLSDGQKRGAEAAREDMRRALGVMSGASTNLRLSRLEDADD